MRPQREEISRDEAFAALGIEAPKIKAKSYVDACEQLQAWKDGPLREAFARAIHAAHPDRGGSDAQAVKVLAARRKLEALQPSQPPPPSKPRAEPPRSGHSARTIVIDGASFEPDEMARFLNELRRFQRKQDEEALARFYARYERERDEWERK